MLCAYISQGADQGELLLQSWCQQWCLKDAARAVAVQRWSLLLSTQLKCPRDYATAFWAPSDTSCPTARLLCTFKRASTDRKEA